MSPDWGGVPVICEASCGGTQWILRHVNPMKIELAHAYPIGTMIVEGQHQPFHALACPLKPVIIQRRRR